MPIHLSSHDRVSARGAARQNCEQLGREPQRRGKTESIKALAASPDGEKLAGMLDRSALERAAKAGDAEALRRLLGSVLRTEEGKRLAENIRRVMLDG